MGIYFPVQIPVTLLLFSQLNCILCCSNSEREQILFLQDCNKNCSEIPASSRVLRKRQIKSNWNDLERICRAVEWNLV